MTGVGAGAGEGEGAWTGVGDELGFSGNEGCNVFCAGAVGTGCTITSGTDVVVTAVAGSSAVSDIFTSFASASVCCA